MTIFSNCDINLILSIIVYSFTVDGSCAADGWAGVMETEGEKEWWRQRGGEGVMETEGEKEWWRHLPRLITSLGEEPLGVKRSYSIRVYPPRFRRVPIRVFPTSSLTPLMKGERLMALLQSLLSFSFLSIWLSVVLLFQYLQPCSLAAQPRRSLVPSSTFLFPSLSSPFFLPINLLVLFSSSAKGSPGSIVLSLCLNTAPSVSWVINQRQPLSCSSRKDDSATEKHVRQAQPGRKGEDSLTGSLKQHHQIPKPGLQKTRIPNSFRRKRERDTWEDK